MGNIKTEIFEYLKSRIGNQLSETDDIFELRLVNSLFYVQLINFIESSFSIKVENDDLDLSNFNTADNIAKFVESKLAKQPLST